MDCSTNAGWPGNAAARQNDRGTTRHKPCWSLLQFSDYPTGTPPAFFGACGECEKPMGPPRSVRAAQTRGGPVGLASVFRAEKIWFWVVALKYANHTKMGPGGRTDHPLLLRVVWGCAQKSDKDLNGYFKSGATFPHDVRIAEDGVLEHLSPDRSPEKPQ